MLTIDGSRGEGGGQILRTALALSLHTQTPFQMHAIRSKRKKPGLLRQHLTCVQAAAQVSGAEVDGDELGSTELTFRPARPRGGSYHFAIGTAGSTTLVLQSLLWGLLFADAPSDLVIEGGTHNPLAPPFDFVQRTFLPLLARMGGHVDVRLERPGFHPAGGGRLHIHIEPTTGLKPLSLLETPRVRRICASALVANLPRDIATRELDVIATQLDIGRADLQIVQLRNALGPGNALVVDIESESLTEVFCGFGEKGVAAESIAASVVTEVREYLQAGVEVGRHLADQLILPLALSRGGAFRTLSLSEHARTQIETVRMFLDVPIAVREEGAVTRVGVGGV